MISGKQWNRSGDTRDCSNHAQSTHRQIQKSSGAQSQKVLDPNRQPKLTRHLAQQPQEHRISRRHPEIAIDCDHANPGEALPNPSEAELRGNRSASESFETECRAQPARGTAGSEDLVIARMAMRLRSSRLFTRALIHRPDSRWSALIQSNPIPSHCRMRYRRQTQTDCASLLPIHFHYSTVPPPVSSFAVSRNRGESL